MTYISPQVQFVATNQLCKQTKEDTYASKTKSEQSSSATPVGARSSSPISSNPFNDFSFTPSSLQTKSSISGSPSSTPPSTRSTSPVPLTPISKDSNLIDTILTPNSARRSQSPTLNNTTNSKVVTIYFKKTTQINTALPNHIPSPTKAKVVRIHNGNNSNQHKPFTPKTYIISPKTNSLLSPTSLDYNSKSNRLLNSNEQRQKQFNDSIKKVDQYLKESNIHSARDEYKNALEQLKTKIRTKRTEIKINKKQLSIINHYNKITASNAINNTLTKEARILNELIPSNLKALSLYGPQLSIEQKMKKTLDTIRQNLETINSLKNSSPLFAKTLESLIEKPAGKKQLISIRQINNLVSLQSIDNFNKYLFNTPKKYPLQPVQEDSTSSGDEINTHSLSVPLTKLPKKNALIETLIDYHIQNLKTELKKQHKSRFRHFKWGSKKGKNPIKQQLANLYYIKHNFTNDEVTKKELSKILSGRLKRYSTQITIKS